MSVTESNQDQGEATLPVLVDGCPPWASEMIAKILVLEVESGTIKNPAAKADAAEWSTTELAALLKTANRMDDDDLRDVAAEVETLFARVARGLSSEGFSPETIADMVNARIPTGCRLAYCNPGEVRDALDA